MSSENLFAFSALHCSSLETVTHTHRKIWSERSSDHLANKHREHGQVLWFPAFSRSWCRQRLFRRAKQKEVQWIKKGSPLLLPAQDSLAKELSLLHNLQKCLLWLGESMQELGLFHFPLIYHSQVFKSCPTSFLSGKPSELFASGFSTELRVSAINGLRAFWGSEMWSLTLCSWDSAHSSLTLYGMKSESYVERSDFSELRKNKTSNLNATECSLSYYKA